MRGVFYVALAIAVLTSNDVVAATNEVQLSSKATPDFVTADGVESRKRFLRVNREQDDNLVSLFEADEERTKASRLKIVKELKMRKQNLKKLAAAAEKVQANPQRLAAVAKRMKVTPQKAPADLSSVDYQRFARFYSNNKSPEQIKKLGLLKPAQLAKYEKFYKVASIKGLNSLKTGA